MANQITNFPTQDVWKSKSKFDYLAWHENSIIKLYQVPFNNDYKDIIDWTPAKLDDYFKDANAEYINSSIRRLKPYKLNKRSGKLAATVKVEIPYESIVDYNYIVLENQKPPVDHAKTNARYRYYYFITSIEYISPSTTHLELELDYWTNFYNDIDIKSLRLETGHYPMILTTPDKFLSDPLSNNAGLLADERETYTAIDTYKIKKSDRLDIIDGKYSFVIVAKNEWKRSYEAKESKIPRKLEDLKKIKLKNYDTATFNSDQPIYTTGINYYCVELNGPGKIPVFLARLEDNYPQFYASILGTISLPLKYARTMYGRSTWDIKMTDKYTIHDINYIYNDEKIIDILNKKNYNYPAPYDKITKLYKSPYAVIKVQTPSGPETIQIEDINKYLTLRYNVGMVLNECVFNFMIGNTGGSKQLAKDKSYYDSDNNVVFRTSLYEDDGMSKRGSWKFPTYSLFMDKYNYDRIMKVGDYLSAIEQADTSANINKALYAADRDNHIATANADMANASTKGANLIANANVENTARTNKTTNDNENSSKITTEKNTRVDRERDTKNTFMDSLKQQADKKTSSDTDNANAHTDTNRQIGQAAIGAGVAAALTSAGASLDGSVPTGSASGSGVAGDFSMGGGSGTGDGISAGWTSANTDVAGGDIAGTAAITAKQFSDRIATTAIGVAATTKLYALAESQKAYNNTGRDIQFIYNDGNLTANKTNNNELANYEKAYNTAENDANVSNRQKNTNVMNVMNSTEASNNSSTLQNTANVSGGTDINNANRLYDARMKNTDKVHETAIDVANNTILAGRIQPSEIIGENLNIDSYADVITNGSARIEFQLRTMPDDKIIEIGDRFLEQGYNYNKYVQSPTLQVMNNFTHWKASDIKIINKGIMNTGVDVIKSMFENGVNVWKDVDAFVNTIPKENI